MGPPAGPRNPPKPRSPEASADLAAAIDDTDWWATLADLDRRRARALQLVDAGSLISYAEPGSAAHRADERIVAQLAESGLRPVGFGSRLVAVESAGPCPDAISACLVVVDRRGAYALVDAAGDVVHEVPETGSSRWVITLVPGAATDDGDPGWRVRKVVADP